MTSSIRSIPPLVPPSRPKKHPSPRLNPRRSCRRSSSGGNRSFLGNQLLGRENDIENKLENECSTTTYEASPHAKPLSSATNNMTSSIPTSPLKSTPRSKARREKQLQHQQEQRLANAETQPLSPTEDMVEEPLSSIMPAPCPQALGSATGSLSSGCQKQEEDEDGAPLSPRTLVMETNTVPAQPDFALTPPVSSPRPLIVAAKRLGNEVRRGNGAKRRRPAEDDDSTSSSDDDDSMTLPNDMSPTQRRKEYWKRCYGASTMPQQLLKSQTSWSASRAAPAKSCLSHSKPPRSNSSHAQIMLPPASAFLQSPPPASDGAPIFSTPKSSPDEIPSLQPQHKCSHTKSVQFGCAQAAEYEIDAPSAKLTPLPPDIAQQRYPLTYKQEENEEEELEETKENSKVLEEWENVFDSFVEDDSDEDAIVKTKKRHSSRKPDSGSSKKEQRSKRSGRRQSTSFCSPGNSKALFDPSLDSDMESSPGKYASTEVFDTMKSLSVASPKQPSQETPEESGQQGDTGLVVPPSNSSEALALDSTVVTQEDTDEELSPSAADFQSLFGVMNVLEEAEKTPFMMGRGDSWDPAVVLVNSAATPTTFWTNLKHTVSNETSDDNPVQTVATLDGYADAVFRQALDLPGISLDVQPNCSQSFDVDCVEPGVLEHLEGLAQYDLKKVEIVFLDKFREKICGLKKKAIDTAIILDSITFPGEASRSPTYQHIRDTEQDIVELERLILEETTKKNDLDLRHASANLHWKVHQTVYSTIATHALDQLCPFSISIERSQHRALFSHMVDGLQTDFALDGSGDNSVSHITSSNDPKPISRGHVAADFYGALLCCDEGESLQRGVLHAMANADDISEILLDLSVVIGRIDLAALSLHQLSEVFEVSLDVLVENNSPVVVVRVHFPRKTILKAFYRRSNGRSLHWSMPSSFSVEQDGEPLEELTSSLSGMTNVRSLEGTAGCLQAACEIVLTTLGTQ